MSWQGTAGGEALQIGAARDKQTAADTAAMSGGASTGAATFAFIQVPASGYHFGYAAPFLYVKKLAIVHVRRLVSTAPATLFIVQLCKHTSRERFCMISDHPVKRLKRLLQPGPMSGASQ